MGALCLALAPPLLPRDYVSCAILTSVPQLTKARTGGGVGGGRSASCC